MPKPAFIFFLALTAAISGCGTVMNISSSTGNMPPKPFGGIAHDLEAASKGDFLGILDIPGSFVGDIVTLPDVLVANEIDRQRVKADGVGTNVGTTSPKPKRVYTYVSATESAEAAPAQQAEAVN